MCCLLSLININGICSCRQHVLMFRVSFHFNCGYTFTTYGIDNKNTIVSRRNKVLFIKHHLLNSPILDWRVPYTPFSSNGAPSVIDFILSNHPCRFIVCNQINTVLSSHWYYCGIVWMSCSEFKRILFI